MKLLILSDTHRYLDNARDVIKRIGGQMEAIIHLGDHDFDAKMLKEEFSEYKFYWVRGNNDGKTDSPSELMLKFAGKNILITHGHRQLVQWNMNTISYYGEENGADATLFGHTHVPFCERSGKTLLFNPGSISQPRQGTTPTFGIIEITPSGEIKGTLMEYLNNGIIKPYDESGFY